VDELECQQDVRQSQDGCCYFPTRREYTLHYLIDNEIDLSLLDARYTNDDTGTPAYDPAVLLKIILYAYSRGITSSRKIEQCCRESMIFMALSADTQPHFTPIADFIATLDQEITKLFLDVLLVCDELGLIGKEMFAVDGCKLPSNASKEGSGTKGDLTKRKEKMERAIRQIVKRHRQIDETETDRDSVEQEQRYAQTLKENVTKIKAWFRHHDDKPGKRGKPVKSTITENESAKMKTFHRIIQGYDGVAIVDAKHQVIVHAEAFGVLKEHDLVQPMVEATRKSLTVINSDRDVFQKNKTHPRQWLSHQKEHADAHGAGHRRLRSGHAVQKTGPPVCGYRPLQRALQKRPGRVLRDKRLIQEKGLYDECGQRKPEANLRACAVSGVRSHRR
jgi:transposase